MIMLIDDLIFEREHKRQWFKSFHTNANEPAITDPLVRRVIENYETRERDRLANNIEHARRAASVGATPARELSDPPPTCPVAGNSNHEQTPATDFF